MALKTFKPYTKSTRGTVVLDKSNLWKGSPYKPLTKGQNFTGGRNNNGRITSRHIGGGSKHKYRIIDFYRKKKNIEKIFKVNVVKVNIINQKSKFKMKQGRKSVKSGYKKAIITLKKGQSIDLTTGI